ncbi:MAG: PEP-CTERM sorting domain-containing protein [bacterium]|nr:PEP-CTERM sorting domain-containing protein [bacterium]
MGGDAVPEPASVGLVLLSVGGLVLRRAKRA